MGSEIIGPTFGDELCAAGLADKVNSFVIGEGADSIYAPDLNRADQAKLAAIIKAHDPTKAATTPKSEPERLLDALIAENIVPESKREAITARLK